MPEPLVINAKIDMDICCPYCGLTMYNYGKYLRCIRHECEGYNTKWHVPEFKLIELTEKDP